MVKLSKNKIHNLKEHSVVKQDALSFIQHKIITMKYILFVLLLTANFTSIAEIIYVNTNSITGNNNGQSWEDAYLNLQDALQNAQKGDEIWVAEGTYYPTSTNDREIYFELPAGVALYGGFNGTEETIEDRNWEENLTILSGDIGVSNDSLDNAYTVVYVNILEGDSTRVLDGLIISQGNANSNESNGIHLFNGVQKNGGGIYIEGESSLWASIPQLINCKLRNNFGKNGGGVFMKGSESSNVVTHTNFSNCIFEYNRAFEGGGIYKLGGGKVSEINVSECIFYRNKALSFGGGIYFANLAGSKRISIANSIFEENEAVSGGGAIAYDDFNLLSGINIENCDFIRNIGDDGGIIYILSFDNTGNFYVENSRFYENLGGTGNIVIYGLENPLGGIIFQNSEFKENFSGQDGGVFFLYESNLLINGCIAANNFSTRGGFIYADDGFTGPNIEIINSVIFGNKGINPTPDNDNNSGPGAISIGRETSANNQYNLKIINSILWNNSKNNPSGKIIDFNSNGDFIMENCLIDEPSCDSIAQNPPTCTNNLYNLDPLFTDTTNLNFHLLPCSPAIDAGNNAAYDGLPFDLDNNPRLQNGTIDIGPYESATIAIEIDTILAVACPAATNGAVNFNIQNACEPYTIEWTSDTATGNSTEGLAAGNYDFLVSDAQGNQTQIQIEIPLIPEDLQVATAAQPIQCTNGVGGTAAAIPMSGVTPFTYEWSNGMTDSLLQNLSVGTYDLTLTDANGCTGMAQTTIEQEGLLGINVNVSPISCHNTIDGTVAVQSVGGQSPFTYQWADGQTDSLLTNLGGGSYSVSITDVFGCEDFLDFSITPPDSLGVVVESLSVDCFNATTGQAVAIPSGGTAPFNFIWDNFQTNDTITNLSAGIYQLTVTDINQCTQTASVEITEPSQIFLASAIESIDCFGENTGMIAAIPNGGITPYTYLWNDNSTDSLLQNLSSGEYQLTLSDANGCTILGDFDLMESDSIHYVVTITNASESDVADGNISAIEMSGGTMPFTYLWNTGDTSASLENLLPDTYELTVTDALGCEKVYVFVVSFTSGTGNGIGEDFAFTLFPNPVTNTLFLEWNTDFQPDYLKLFDVLGKSVFEMQGADSQLLRKIGMQKFSSGTYFLEIGNAEVRVVRKVLKK